MRLEFTKMHGIGNDYIYIDCIKKNVELDAETIVKLSDRNFGIGSDGVIFIGPSVVADGKMDMYNADGSSSQMCGNGIRCVGKFLYDRGYVQGSTVMIETPSGTKKLEMLVADGVATGATVDMGTAVLECAEIPVNYSGSNVDIPITVGRRSYTMTCVSMGNPHAVVFVDDVKQIDISSIGPMFENHSMFPERVNTEFIRVISNTELDMRVWERGSGETLACGTGACAAVVAAVLNGYCEYDQTVTVHLLGGDLKVDYSKNGDVAMTGDAVEVYNGYAEM